jgi:hypothetical protein
VCPNAVIAHGQLPTDPLVIGIVLSELGPGPLSTPRQTECSILRAIGSGRGLPP